MRRMVVLILFSALVAGVASCAPGPVSSPVAPQATPKPISGATRAEWEVKWEKTLAEARAEGEILAYFNAPSEARVAIPEAFNKKLGLIMNIVSGSAAELNTRLNSEYRAGINQADILLAGSSSIWATVKPNGFLSPIEPALILPEVRDVQKWRQGKLPFFDKDGHAVSFFMQVIPPVVYNSQMVKSGDITSYTDLLKPEWKGKIVMFDPGIAGAAQFGVTTLTMIWDLDKARGYLSSLLRQQETVVTRDQRQQMEWVAHGKYPVALWPQTPAVIEFIKVGAPLAAADIKEEKAASASNGGLALPNRPPHSRATTVFVNWFLSQEGQTLAVKTMGAPSTRVDVAPEGVAEMFIVKPGDRIIVQNEELATVQNKLIDEWRKIIASGGR